MKLFLTTCAIAATAAFATAGDVHPGVIFGSGNANGGFRLAENNDVEIGLRGKVRYNSAGVPENTFNWDGDETYTFDPRDSANPSNRSIFNFEFSINTDVNDDTSSGNNLNDFTYLLTVSRLNDDGMGITVLFAFDPMNSVNPGNSEVLWDHSMGDNDTLASAGIEATDAANYASLLASSNVAQQSWNLGFFNSQPTRAGTYFIGLSVFDQMGEVVSNGITINVVPVPTAAFAGLGLLGVLGGARVIRRR